LRSVGTGGRFAASTSDQNINIGEVIGTTNREGRPRRRKRRRSQKTEVALEAQNRIDDSCWVRLIIRTSRQELKPEAATGWLRPSGVGGSAEIPKVVVALMQNDDPICARSKVKVPGALPLYAIGLV